MGLDAWIEAELKPCQLDDPVGARALQSFPTVSMTTAQIGRAGTTDHEVR
jgi:hypothetical protein